MSKIMILLAKQIYSLLPARVLSRPWLVQIRLNLGFPQSIATAMDFGPAQRSTESVLRQHPGYWFNMQA